MLEKNNKIIIPLAIIAAGIIFAAAFIFVNQEKIKETTGEELPAEQVAEETINYINKNLLSQGMVASLVDVSDTGSIYKVRLKIGEQEYESYVSKDGVFLFPEGGINMKEKITAENEEEKKLTCEDLQKTDEPLLEAFVVSECPFGTQMQRILTEIVKNIPSLAENMKVRYIGAIEGDKITSMHGDEEAQENLRQICLREEQSDKYWDYINCHIKKGEVEGCLTATGIDEAKLSNCMEDNSKGLKYAKEDFDAQEKYKATGSPSLFLNEEKVNEFDFGGRTAESVKTLLCCGFKTEPSTCSQKLNEAQVSTGFSETYSQSSGFPEGSCK